MRSRVRAITSLRRSRGLARCWTNSTRRCSLSPTIGTAPSSRKWRYYASAGESRQAPRSSSTASGSQVENQRRAYEACRPPHLAPRHKDQADDSRGAPARFRRPAATHCHRRSSNQASIYTGTAGCLRTVPSPNLADVIRTYHFQAFASNVISAPLVGFCSIRK